MIDGRPHIVHVLHSLEVGGTENGVVNLVSTLRGDFRHSIVATTATGVLARRLPPEVQVYAIGKRPGADWKAVLRLARLLSTLRPDILHTRNWSGIDGILAGRLAGCRRVIHGEHGREASDPDGRSRKRRVIRRIVSPFVGRFVAVSGDLQRWLTMTVGIPASRVTLIHNGVDAARFVGGEQDASRRSLGAAPGRFLIGTVGRLDPVKGHLFLLDAVGTLARERPNAMLCVVGDGPCRAALERRAAAPDLSGRVVLTGERSDVPALLRGFDVFVLPSLAEGMSNTLLEAMATGLPVIATATGGNVELVEPDVTGLLIPVGDAAGLAEGLRRYLDDPHLRVLHGKAGRERVLAEFSLERMAGRYRDLYTVLLRHDGERR